MKRIVLKLGTGILSEDAGRCLDRAQFERLAAEISEIIHSGHQIVLVSSGAIAAGVPLLGLTERPLDVAGKQACAAVGQPQLMECYGECFRKHQIRVGQLLLSHSDIDSRLRRENAKNTIERLLETNEVLPIVNENDSVAVEELRFGDNDRLSAEVAVMIRAELLVILTGVDGLMDGNALVPKVDDIQKAFELVTEETGRFSVGGMRTKLEAARIAGHGGIPTVIAGGRTPGLLFEIAAGKSVGTLIPPSASGKLLA